MNEIKKILLIIKKLSISLRLIIFLYIINGLLEMSGIYALYYVISKTISGEKIFGYEIMQNNSILYAVLFLIILFLIKNVVSFLINNFSLKVIERIHEKLKYITLIKIINLPNKIFETYNNSELSKIVFSEVETVINQGVLQLILLISEVATIVIVAIFLIYNNPHFFFIVILFALFIFLYTYLIKIKLLRISAAIQSSAFDLASLLKEIIHNNLYINLYDKGEYFVEKFKIYSRLFVDQLSKSQKIGLFHRYFLEMIIVSLISVLMLINDRAELMPILTIYGLAAFRLSPSVGRIISALNSIKLTSSSLAVLDQINLNSIDPTHLHETEAPDLKIIELSNIQTLINIGKINLTAREGDVVVFHGKSGAGKSTLLKVISGFIKPSEGNISINCSQIYDPKLLKINIAYLGQDYKLIKGTVLDNIAFGVPESLIDYDLIYQILDLLQIHDIVLPEFGGLLRKIKEDGEGLSGGQKQRIAIARTLYSGRKILILDEPTSSLDIESKAKLMLAIEKIRSKKIIFIASHDQMILENDSYIRFRIT